MSNAATTPPKRGSLSPAPSVVPGSRVSPRVTFAASPSVSPVLSRSVSASTGDASRSPSQDRVATSVRASGSRGPIGSLEDDGTFCAQCGMEFGLIQLLDKHDASGVHSHHAMDVEAQFDAGKPKVLCLVCDELMGEELLRQHRLTQKHLAGLMELRERHVVDLSFHVSDSDSSRASSRESTPDVADPRLEAALARKRAFDAVAAAAPASEASSVGEADGSLERSVEANTAASDADAEATRTEAAAALAARANSFLDEYSRDTTSASPSPAASPVKRGPAAARAETADGVAAAAAAAAAATAAAAAAKAKAVDHRAAAAAASQAAADARRAASAAAAAAARAASGSGAGAGPAGSASARTSAERRATQAEQRQAQRRDDEARRAAAAAAWIAERKAAAAAAAVAAGPGAQPRSHATIQLLPAPDGADPTRNRGVVFSSKALAWVQGAQVNRPAVELRVETHKTRRTVKRKWQLGWLLRVVAVMDLTTLSGDDTWGNVSRLAFKASAPVRKDLLAAAGLAADRVLRVASVSVYPNRIADACKTLSSIASPVPVCSAAGGFPAAETPLATRVAETQAALDAGASEMDVVFPRQYAIDGNWAGLYDEVRTFRALCGERALLKAVLAVGELPTLRDVYKATLVAMMAGADFVSASTGKEALNATLPVGLVIIRAIRDFADRTDQRVGFKVAGGIRSAKDATAWLTLVLDELGEEWTRPRLFRIGASTLVTDIERQLEHGTSGAYGADHYNPMP